MITYSHDYTKPSIVRAMLRNCWHEMRLGNSIDAVDIIEGCIDKLDAYLSGDNMVEDEEPNTGWVRCDSMKMEIELAVINFRKGDELAQVISNGESTRSYEIDDVKRHRSILKAIAYLEAKGYNVSPDDKW